MIDLALGHKSGLTLQNPIILGVGAIGCGEAKPRSLDIARMGAAVVGPILHGSRAGSSPPRVAETNGGLVMQTGLQNRGVRAVMQRYAPLWARLGCPVIAHVADSRLAAVRAVVEHLTYVDGLVGVELALSRQADTHTTAALIGQAVEATELPVCVKLPLERTAQLARFAADAGAACLVVGLPTLGTLYRPSVIGNGGIYARAPSGGVVGTPLRGEVYGPLTFVLVLQALEEVASLGLSCGLVACGGIHTWGHVEQALAAGALAVQLDSAVWVEPGVPGRLVAEWEARHTALEQR